MMAWRAEEIVCVALFVAVAVGLPCCLCCCWHCNPWWKYEPLPFVCWVCWHRWRARVDCEDVHA